MRIRDDVIFATHNKMGANKIFRNIYYHQKKRLFTIMDKGNDNYTRLATWGYERVLDKDYNYRCLSAYKFIYDTIKS